jgi:putative toxin-antitoxin system antitoxin component (TIGR02293 family)
MPGIPRPRGPHSDSDLLNELISVTDEDLITATRAGLHVRIIDDLARHLQVTANHIRDLVGISSATYTRMVRKHRRLSPLTSDRAVRFSTLWKHAVELWGSEEGAREWLTTPEIALGGQTPLTYADTEVGARHVEALMGQIAYGIVT